MPAKKGDAKPASTAKKAAAPAKGAAKATAKAASKAAAKSSAKAANVKKPAQTQKAPAKAVSKGAVKGASKKAAAKTTVAKTAVKAVVKTPKPQIPKVKKLIKKGSKKRIMPRINRKKLVSYRLRQQRKEKFERILIERRRANKRVWEEKQKKPKVTRVQREEKKKARAEKPKLTAEQKKALGPYKQLHFRYKLPKALQLSTRLTTKGAVWTPHVYKHPKGFNALKLRNAKLNQVHRAVKAKNMLGGGIKKRNLRKIWTKTQFRRPKTRRSPKNPQYPRKSIPSRPRLDQFAILKHPYTTETAMKKLDDENTLVFVVDMKANKHKIRAAVKKMYDIRPFSVRTVVTPLATKKAFVRLHPDNDALDVANKIGMV